MFDFKLGVLVDLNKTLDEKLKKMKGMGFETCQLVCWDHSLLTDEMAQKVNDCVSSLNIEITAFWCGWSGPEIWNFYSGPITQGFVPPAYRFKRMEDLCRGSDFAKKINVVDVVTHAGFIPENPNDPDYLGTVEAIRHIANYCRKNGQYFLFESGQETPITLKRLIVDVGLDNLGINLDPANLLMYGKANPADALDVFGEYVRGVHAKDGEYPVNPRELGVEKPLGEGRVNFPVLLNKLRRLGYKGALTIEREISGEDQINDIINGKKFLEHIIS